MKIGKILRGCLLDFWNVSTLFFMVLLLYGFMVNHKFDWKSVKYLGRVFLWKLGDLKWPQRGQTIVEKCRERASRPHRGRTILVRYDLSEVGNPFLLIVSTIIRPLWGHFWTLYFFIRKPYSLNRKIWKNFKWNKWMDKIN